MVTISTSFSFMSLKGVVAQGRVDVLSPVRLRHCEERDIAVALGRIDRPGHVVGDRSVAGLGNGHVLAGRRVVQRRGLGAVVIGPPTVLVTEDHLSD